MMKSDFQDNNCYAKTVEALQLMTYEEILIEEKVYEIDQNFVITTTSDPHHNQKEKRILHQIKKDFEVPKFNYTNLLSRASN